MIIRARSLLTMDGPPIENGAVAITGDQIVDVGAYPDVRRDNAGEVVDLGERVLLPGLINAHCHLDYTCLRGAIARQESFTDWIGAINQAKAALTPDDYVRSIESGFAEAASFGTTTIANLEAFPKLLSRIVPAAMRTWWFAELIDARQPVPAREIYEQMRGDLVKTGDRLSRIGLAPHAPFTASAELYRECAEVAAAHDLRLTTHLAESREERLMFGGAGGPLFEFMKTIGRSTDDCGHGTPFEWMLSRGLPDARWLIAHLNELSERDFELLRSAPKFHIVHCPRSHAYFRHSPVPLRRLRELGFNVCIGTDSLASNNDLSLFRELRQLASIEPSLRAEEMFAMVTSGAAAALGQQEWLGRVRSGFVADLIAVEVAAVSNDCFEELLEFDGPVGWRTVAGQQLTSA
jgi:cytosine/adenosine deaminase-related metal-dependent hydrolase